MESLEQAPKIEIEPLNQRVTEFLTAFAEEKAREQTPKGKETLAMAQVASCYRLAADVTENNINSPLILKKVKEYGFKYFEVLDKKRLKAEEMVTKNPAKKTYEDLEKADRQTLDALLMKTEFLNRKGSLSDPSKITDLKDRDRVKRDQEFTAKLFGDKLKRSVKEATELFVYSRQKQNLKRLNDKLKAMGDTLQDLNKIVPRKA